MLRLSARVTGSAVVALALLGAPARAEDDPTFDAYNQCFSEQMVTSCLAHTPVDDYAKAVATQCGDVRKAYAAAKAARLVTAKGLSADKAAAEAERQIAWVEKAMTGEYRKCLGDPG